MAKRAKLAVGVAVVFVGALGALGACGPGAANDAVGDRRAAILGGTADTTDNAVMAFIHQTSATMSDACTGTLISKSGSSGIFITAGHCVVANDGTKVTIPITVAPVTDLFVVPGNDWMTSLRTNQYFNVSAVEVHPSYDGSVNSPYDVALVRFVGATASMPTIPALAASEDTLAVGSTFTLVGYGETGVNQNNSQRLEVGRTIQTLTDHQFLYSQTDMKGACSGDSGGPALVSTPNGLRVAGVTSFGDTNCTQIGVSVRISPLGSFISSFINGTPLVLSCDECTAGAVSPGNTCVNQGSACDTGSTACGMFLNCADACTTTSCEQGCESKYASGASAYDALAKCQCTACATACASASACSPYLGGGTTTPPGSMACGGLTDVRPACASCITNTCCTQASDCENDPVCTACLGQSDPSCRVNSAFSKLVACEATCVGAPCSASATTPTGGDTGSAGVTGAAGAAGTSGAAGSDATPIATPGGKSGCSCSTGASPPSSLASLLPFAALVVARRRRGRAAR